MEEEIINKRKALANHRKEITKIQFLESFQHNLPLGGPSSAHAAPLPPPPPTVIPVSSSPNNSQYSPIDKNYSQSSNILHSTRKYLDFHELLPSSSSSTTRRPASEEYHGEYDPNQLEEELNSAKKVMEMAKNGIHRTSQKRIQNERFLQNENKFLNNMKRR